MKSSFSSDAACALVSALALPATGAQAASEEKLDFTAGLELYQRYCQSCHGERGRGDGRVGKWLKVPPADFSGLSERNDGVFPEERVAQVIDGREDVRTHGSREMPIWGKVLAEEVAGPDVEEQVGRQIAVLTEVLRWFDAPLSDDTADDD